VNQGSFINFGDFVAGTRMPMLRMHSLGPFHMTPPPRQVSLLSIIIHMTYLTTGRWLIPQRATNTLLSKVTLRCTLTNLPNPLKTTYPKHNSRGMYI